MISLAYISYFDALNKQDKSSLKSENQSIQLLISYRIAESERLKDVFEKEAHWMFLLVPTWHTGESFKLRLLYLLLILTKLCCYRHTLPCLARSMIQSAHKPSVTLCHLFLPQSHDVCGESGNKCAFVLRCSGMDLSTMTAKYNFSS